MGWLGWKMEYPLGGVKEREPLPLARYDFDSLREVYKVHKVNKVYKVEILDNIKEVEERRKGKYDFATRQFRFLSEGRWITGMINYHPEKSSLSPVIIMIRGYADKAGYYSGYGTWRVADELAGAGFATMSIDFLGFGGSDGESIDMLEARFEKVVGVLDLIESVKQLPWVDKERIGIWAHSNGGQIALSILEITGENYPTILWAPMTNPFPQSVLDTADDLDDKGAAVKKAIADFEKKYDSRRYAFDNYLNWIEAPMAIYQGTADEWCKAEWQEGLQGRLVNLGKRVELKILPGDDHNLGKNWGEVVEENVEWYGKIVQ